METMPQFRIEPLEAERHQRASFSCESAELTAFLRQRARKEAESMVSACFVIVPISDAGLIAGYYTLSATSITLTDLPENMVKKLPRYPVMPATLIGRLARDINFRSLGIGALLMRDALHRAWLHSSEIGSVAVVTDPKDEHASRFYAKYGFKRLNERRMFVSMRDVGQWAKGDFLKAD
jgi:predicted GNAT family N-acyltransferase